MFSEHKEDVNKQIKYLFNKMFSQFKEETKS